MVERPHEIDPNDPSTWVRPVDAKPGKTGLVNTYWVEYAVPICPNAMIMAIKQLPDFVPRGVVAFSRFMLTKSNIERDGRHKGTFALEVSWPHGDIFAKPLDDTDDA